MNSELIMTDNDTTFFKTFGQRITDMRKARGLTQAQLGETLGLDQTAVASYEIGRRRVPLSLLAPLAKALGVSVAELVEDAKGPGKRGPAAQAPAPARSSNPAPASQAEVRQRVLGHRAAGPDGRLGRVSGQPGG